MKKHKNLEDYFYKSLSKFKEENVDVDIRKFFKEMAADLEKIVEDEVGVKVIRRLIGKT